MKKYTLLLLAISFLGLIACSEKDGVLFFTLDAPFTIEQGATATFDDNNAIQVRFDQVTEDSRCPIDVECVWAGRAEIKLTFIQPGDTQTNQLILGDSNGSDYTNEATFGDYKVTLLEVKPDPKENLSISQSDYAVTLEVSTN